MRPRQTQIFRSPDGAIFQACAEKAHSTRPSDTHAWINHYWSKSFEEAMVKLSRNHGDESTLSRRSAIDIADKLLHRLIIPEQQYEPVEDSRCVVYSPGLSERVKELRSLPGVTEAHRAVVASHESRVAQLAVCLLATEGHAERTFKPVYDRLRAAGHPKPVDFGFRKSDPPIINAKRDRSAAVALQIERTGVQGNEIEHLPSLPDVAQLPMETWVALFATALDQTPPPRLPSSVAVNPRVRRIKRRSRTRLLLLAAGCISMVVVQSRQLG